jgi:signal transduction histidine kinase
VLKSEHLVRDEHGAETLEGILSDVTEGKRMEVRLVQAERLASLAALAAGVAHEIDYPLASILANLDYVLEALRRSQADRADVAPADLIDALRETRQAARRVLATVRDLGTLSRGPLDPEQQRRDSTDPHAVLDSVLGLLDNEIRRRARLVKDYGAAPRVAGDAVRLGQVFLNLLVNAVQAMPEGDPSSNELRIRTFTDEAGRFAVEIGDTGGGIAAETLPRIFEPFFTTKPAGLGSGLGLAICHGIVADLGGQIAVDSQPGRGARFRVTLPPSSSGSPAAPTRPSPAPSASGT